VRRTKQLSIKVGIPTRQKYAVRPMIFLAVDYHPARRDELNVVESLNVTTPPTPNRQRDQVTQTHKIMGVRHRRFFAPKNKGGGQKRMDVKDVNDMPNKS